MWRCDILNDFEFFSDTKKIDVAVADAKQTFGENTPYVIETKITGKTILFNTHFITTIREALTTGCMAKMSSNEELLFLDFISYQNGDGFRDISSNVNDILKALDIWMTNELKCIPNGAVNSCFIDTVHTWESCPVA